MTTAFFSKAVLNRVRLVSEFEREHFKLLSRRVELRDEETGVRLVAYIRDDGHVLMDEIIQP
jgi:hypothetical protein